MNSSAFNTFSQLWERMMQFSTRGAQSMLVTLLASSALAVALGVPGYWWLVSPRTAANATAAEAVAKLEAENATNRETERNDPQFRAEIAKIVRLYELARPMLPTSAEVGGVLAQVQQEASRHGVTLSSLSGVKADVKSPSWDKLYQREYPATANGSHAQVVRFFYAVSTLDRIVLLPNFTETSLRQRVSVSFPLFAYTAPPPNELPKLPEGFAPLSAAPPDDAATPQE